jgi:predicted transcriptional regulator
MPMELEKRNNEVMAPDFSTISADASLKEAYASMEKNLQGPPHSPGLVVVNEKGKYAGVLTMDDLMNELRQFYRDACDKPGKGEWIAAFFNQCEILGIKKVSEIMSAKRLSIRSGDRFEKSCEWILYKRLNLLAVVDENSKPVGIITRRMVLREIGSRMFK